MSLILSAFFFFCINLRKGIKLLARGQVSGRRMCCYYGSSQNDALLWGLQNGWSLLFYSTLPEPMALLTSTVNAKYGIYHRTLLAKQRISTSIRLHFRYYKLFGTFSCSPAPFWKRESSRCSKLIGRITSPHNRNMHSDYLKGSHITACFSYLPPRKTVWGSRWGKKVKYSIMPSSCPWTFILIDRSLRLIILLHSHPSFEHGYKELCCDSNLNWRTAS